MYIRMVLSSAINIKNRLSSRLFVTMFQLYKYTNGSKYETYQTLLTISVRRVKTDVLQVSKVHVHETRLYLNDC